MQRDVPHAYMPRHIIKVLGVEVRVGHKVGLSKLEPHDVFEAAVSHGDIGIENGETLSICLVPV